MRKQLVIIGIVALFVCIGFSGCNEQSNNGITSGDTDKVELVSYDVETIPILGEEYKEYTGIIRNIAGKMLDTIRVNVHFYDSINNLLNTKTDYVYSLANNYTKEFQVVYQSYEKSYGNIHYVKFEFIVS